MEWLRINKGLPQHPKSKALARALGEPASWWRVAQVWAWCVEYAQDGRIETLDPVVDIEDAAGWAGERGVFVDACVRVNFLDKTEKGFVVHDWHEHNGAALKSAVKAAKRMRKYRDRKKNPDSTKNGNVTRTLREQNAHVLGNTTPPNTTPPNEDQRDTSAVADDAPVRIYACWRQTWAPRAADRLDAKRRKRIVALLRDRTERQILDSLAGWKNDPWPERPRQATLEILLRDAGQVDKGLELLAQGPAAPTGRDLADHPADAYDHASTGALARSTP